MAKCGHDICPDDSCGWKHPFSKKRRNRCRNIQQCFEVNCSSLKALGPSGFVLYDACLGHCHAASGNPNNPASYASPNDYICNTFDPVTLVDYFGVNVCGVPEEETKVGQVKEAAAASSASNQQALLFIGAIVLVLLFIFWRKKGK